MHFLAVGELLEQAVVLLEGLLEAEARLVAPGEPQPRDRVLGVEGRRPAIHALGDLERTGSFEAAAHALAGEGQGLVVGTAGDLRSELEQAHFELVARRLGEPEVQNLLPVDRVGAGLDVGVPAAPGVGVQPHPQDRLVPAALVDLEPVAILVLDPTELRPGGLGDPVVAGAIAFEASTTLLVGLVGVGIGILVALGVDQGPGSFLGVALGHAEEHLVGRKVALVGDLVEEGGEIERRDPRAQEPPEGLRRGPGIGRRQEPFDDDRRRLRQRQGR